MKLKKQKTNQNPTSPIRLIFIIGVIAAPVALTLLILLVDGIDTRLVVVPILIALISALQIGALVWSARRSS